MLCPKWIPKADDPVDSHACCQPQQYAWVVQLVTSLIMGGWVISARNLAVNVSHVIGGENVLSRTCSNALVWPYSPKISSECGVRRGVCHAWVKRWPASAKQACSNSIFLECSFHSPVLSSGATTMDKGWFTPVGFKICQTFWAVFLIRSVLQSCFHKDSFGLFHASNCTAISCTIHVSWCVSSCFNHQNCLCVQEMCSSRVCCVYSPGCGTVGRPAFLACVHNIDRPTLLPFVLRGSSKIGSC